MKITSILLHHLAISYCSEATSAVLANTSSEPSQITKDPKAPIDGSSLLQVKEDLDPLTNDLKFETAYCNNSKRFNNTLSKLSGRENLYFEDKIRRVLGVVETHLRKRIVLSMPSNCDSTCHPADKLYSKLSELKVLQYACQDILPQVNFFEAVVNQGRKGEILSEQNSGFIYSWISNDFSIFLGETKSKLEKMKNAIPEKIVPLNQAIDSISSAIKSIEATKGQINAEFENLYDFINVKSDLQSEALLKVPEFTAFCTNLANFTVWLNKDFQKCVSEYEKLYEIGNEKVKEFLRENSKVFYYTLSAFKVLKSMNEFFIKLPDLYTKPQSGGGWLSNIGMRTWDWCLTRIWRAKKPVDCVVDLASKLVIHLIDNDDAIFENLENGNFDKLESAKSEASKAIVSVPNGSSADDLAKLDKKNEDRLNAIIQGLEVLKGQDGIKELEGFKNEIASLEAELIQPDDSIKAALEKVKNAFKKKEESLKSKDIPSDTTRNVMFVVVLSVVTLLVVGLCGIAWKFKVINRYFNTN